MLSKITQEFLEYAQTDHHSLHFIDVRFSERTPDEDRLPIIDNPWVGHQTAGMPCKVVCSSRISACALTSMWFGTADGWRGHVESC
jgi:hypothetical protein